MMLLSYIVEMEMIIWRNFHHRRHRKLSKRDLNVLSNLIHCFDDNDFQKIAEMINSLPQMMSIKVANPSSLTVLTFLYFQWNLNHNTPKIFWHHDDVIIDAMASQITSLTIVYPTVIQTQIKENIKLRVTGLCVGHSPGTGEFPAQLASNAENVFIGWSHRELLPAICGHNDQKLM